MNEEIKIQIKKELYATYPQLLDVPYNMWLFIERKLEESYLQGAKDMAVFIDTLKIVEAPDEILKSKRKLDRNFVFGCGQLVFLSKVHFSAQQFIDSLEKGEKNV